MILADPQALGHIAEAVGKGIGLAWLLGHHGKAVWKTLFAKKGPRRSLANDADAQIAQKEQDDQDGRLIREAIFNQLEQSQQIENLTAIVNLRESEVAMYKNLSTEFQRASNEWQADAVNWRSQAHEAQQELKMRDGAWAGIGTTYSEQLSYATQAWAAANAPK